MIRYNNAVVNQFGTVSASGNSGANLPITIRFSEGGQKAPIFSDDGITEIDNPLLSDSLGNYGFFVADGTYDITINEGEVSEQTIPNVSIFGPPGTQSDITYYVSPTGSDLNNGLTESSPFQNIQAAVEAISDNGDIFPSVYTIKLEAGTYDRARFNDEGMGTQGIITIEGPDVGGHPNVPTAIITEGPLVTGFGVLCSQDTKVRLKDIKLVGWNGSTASTGFRGNGGCWIYTENVHAENCYDGVGGYENSVVDVKGGIFEGCGYLDNNPAQGTGFAFKGLFNTKFQVGTQNAGTLNGGPIVRNCASVARQQEGGVGHLDYVTVEDCDQGVRLLVNSRLNLAGTSFKRVANSAIYATQGCYADTDGTEFGTGVDANGANYSIGHSSSLSATGIQGINTANSASEYVFSTSYPKQIINNTTNEPIESYTIDENSLNDTQFSAVQSNRVGVRVTGELSGSNDFKRLNLRVGSTQQTISFTSASVGNGFTADLSVDFIGTDEQYLRAFGASDQETDTSSLFITESTSSDLTVQLEAVVGNALDSITINSVEWYQRGF